MYNSVEDLCTSLNGNVKCLKYKWTAKTSIKIKAIGYSKKCPIVENTSEKYCHLYIKTHFQPWSVHYIQTEILKQSELFTKTCT